MRAEADIRLPEDNKSKGAAGPYPEGTLLAYPFYNQPIQTTMANPSISNDTKAGKALAGPPPDSPWILFAMFLYILIIIWFVRAEGGFRGSYRTTVREEGGMQVSVQCTPCRGQRGPLAGPLILAAETFKRRPQACRFSPAKRSRRVGKKDEKIRDGDAASGGRRTPDCLAEHSGKVIFFHGDRRGYINSSSLHCKKDIFKYSFQTMALIP